jgi:PAS domain S-box-containing protein
MEDKYIVEEQHMEELVEVRESVAELEALGAKYTRLEKVMNEREALYKTLLEASSYAVTTTDSAGRITSISQRALELHGFERAEELIGENALSLIDPEDHYRAVMDLQRTSREGVVRDAEYRMLRKDGTHFIGVLDMASIQEPLGVLKGFITTIRDTIERKNDAKLSGKSAETEREYISAPTNTAEGSAELLPEDNIYLSIGKKLKALVGDSIVIITAFDAASDVFCVRAILGRGEHIETILKLLGKHPVGMSIKTIDEFRSSFSAGKLVKLPGELHKLTSRKIPENVGWSLKKILRLSDIYSMGFVTEEELFGAVVIITREGKEIEKRDRDTIETLINQASVALYTIH